MTGGTGSYAIRIPVIVSGLTGEVSVPQA